MDETSLPLIAEPLQSKETMNSRCKTTPFPGSKDCEFGPCNSYNFAIKPLVKM
jgi:hypothetical protein